MIHLKTIIVLSTLLVFTQSGAIAADSQVNGSQHPTQDKQHNVALNKDKKQKKRKNRKMRKKANNMGSYMRMYKGVKLTKEQRKEIMKILKAVKKENKPQQKILRKLRNDLVKLSQSDNYSIETVKKVAQQMSKMQMNILISTNQAQQTAWQVLTEEQKKLVMVKKKS